MILAESSMHRLGCQSPGRWPILEVWFPVPSWMHPPIKPPIRLWRTRPPTKLPEIGTGHQ